MLQPLCLLKKMKITQVTHVLLLLTHSPFYLPFPGSIPQLHKATNNKRTGPCEWSFAYPPSGKCAAAELQKRCMPGRLECRPKQNIAVMAVSFPKALPNQRAQRLNLKFTCRACQRQVPTISTALILCNPRSKLLNFIPCMVPLSEMVHKFHDL